MRLNINIEEYNLQMDLEELYLTFKEYIKQCEQLEELGRFIKRKIVQAHSEFTSDNFKRTNEAVDDYLKRLKVQKEELDELMKSCIQLAIKLGIINEPW